VSTAKHIIRVLFSFRDSKAVPPGDGRFEKIAFCSDNGRAKDKEREDDEIFFR